MASSFLFLIHFLILVFLPLNLEAAQEDEGRVFNFRCRHNGPSIRFPFWVKGFHLDRYRYPGFELSCDKNKQTVLDLLFSVKLFVKKIDYKSQVIRLYDPDGCVPAKASKPQLADKLIPRFLAFELPPTECKPYGLWRQLMIIL
ncbi:unnamed protein product [Ilex paraguariensis]|uniref:RING-type E3 ubiquitin transferase n=1 Tax=Ilex paraguariensis TaxID=185542 RepID=A0ABC8TBL9_9AQUA